MTASSSSVDGRPRRRDEILEAAAGLFAADGYRTTSMREVAAASGILAGSLYHHFPSKDAMAAEILSGFSDRLTAAYREVLGAGDSAAETLEAIC